MEAAQRPLELILARNFLTSVATPALLVDAEGTMLFYNEAAAALLGRPFEEAGRMRVEEWLQAFGPVDDESVELERIDLARAIESRKPTLGEFRIRVAGGEFRSIEAAAFPIVASQDRSSGAMIMFWTRLDNGTT